MTHILLHVIPSLARGGIVTQVLQLAATLPRGEFTQSVVALDHNRESVADFRARAIEPVILGSRWPLDPITCLRLQRLLAKLRPQIIHAWSPAAQRIAAVTGLVSGPSALVVSERKIRSTPGSRLSPFNRWLIGRTARFIATSEAVRANCVARGNEASKISVVTAGVALAETGASQAASSVKADLRLPETAKLIACVGSLAVDKRLKELIWATDQLKAVGIEAHLLLVGEGALKQQLERYAWLNRISHRVHFVGSRSDVQNVLRQCDVFWRASADDSPSNAILEAMAAGLPVVAADSCGTRELVIPAQTGFLVPLGERAGFARWTLPLLESPAQAKQVGAAGKERARAHHGVEQMIARFAEVYREVSEKSRKKFSPLARRARAVR